MPLFKRQPVLPAYAQAALRESEKLEPVIRFHAPPIVVEQVPPVRFTHPRLSKPVDWIPSEKVA